MAHGLPRRTYLYFAAQSINLTTAVMSVTMAATVGADLAPSASLSTIPYGVQFLLLMLATYPAAQLMSRLGRRPAFMLGAVALVVAGVSGFWAVEHRQFGLLVFSHGALGVYIAFANFNRFAATDGLAQALKPKALSLVVAGGVVAAVVGPTLTQWLRDLGGYPLFSLCYAAFGVLAGLSFVVALCLPAQPRQAMPSPAAAPVALTGRGFTPEVVLAIATAALGYGIMNLLMIQSSMHLQHMDSTFSQVRVAIQWHVIAMFAPSFFTGAIIQRIGLKHTIAAGLILLIGCAILNLSVMGYTPMVVSLVVLGLGWNLTYVGGGALLSQALQHHGAAMQMQGKNDLVIAVAATIGAFMPSPLLGTVGWGGTNLICMGLCIVLLATVLRPTPAPRQARTL